MNDSTLAKTAYAHQLQSKCEVGKKPYSAPRLIEYGDLVEITGSGGSLRRDGVSSRRS